MSKPGPKVDPDLVVQIALDADLFGVGAAATRHGVSEDTVSRYRQRVQSDAILRELAAAKKAPIVAGWIEATEQARQQILRRVMELAATSDNLHEVSGALKIVTDANIAERVVANGLGQSGAGASGEGATPAEASQAMERLAPPVAVH